MKKVLFNVFTWMLAGAMLVSCRKDDDNKDNEQPQQQNIVQIAQANADFSILVQALTRSDLSVNYAQVLSGEGPFTVFAPNNAAFTALLTELGVSSLNDIPAPVLEAVLTYHVVAGRVTSNMLTNGQVVTTLNGGTFTVNTQGGVTITDANERTATVIQADITASNGVIHAIDKVILPAL
ncbi:fasciclin domain-containing protein, partial [Schleiferia thermophila]|uniref:fasciclin domain-containing protein n=1 Tax=Schleiferia thermophila TaxID=884107 RepID=UPI0005601F72